MLKLRIVEPEHLIFLKGVTGRPVDKEDMTRIVKNLEINWELFLELVKKYYKKDDRIVWLLLGNLYDINEKE